MDPSPVVAPIAKTAASKGGGLLWRLTWRWRLAYLATRQLDKPRPWKSVASWLRRADITASLAQTHTAPPSMAVQLDRYLETNDAQWAGLPTPTRTHRAELIVSELHRRLPDVRSEKALTTLVQRQASMVNQVGAGQAVVVEQIRDLGAAVTALAHADDEALFQERLLLLPPYRRAELIATRRSDPAAVLQLTVSLTDPLIQPHVVLTDWDQESPRWLAQASAAVQLITAKLVLDYDHPQLASRLFVAAVEAGAVGRHHWIGRAALARPDDDELAIALLEGLGTPEHSNDPLVRSLYAALKGSWQTFDDELTRWKPNDSSAWSLYAGLQTRRDFLQGNERAVSAAMLDDAITHVRQTLMQLPVDPDLRAPLLLAEAKYMIMRVALGASRDPVRDLDAVQRQAQEVRDRRRPWRGNSAKAVAIGTKAAILTGDFETVLRLGLPGYETRPTVLRGPGATDQEAAHPDVRRNVLLAQLALNKAPQEPDLSGLPPFHERELRALLAESAGENAGDLWQAAYDETSDDNERGVALLGLAHHGRSPDDSESRVLLAEFPVFAAQVEAAKLEAAGDLEGAVAVLQGQVHSSPAAATILGQLLERTERTDAAVTVYLDAAARFSDPELTVMASRVLWRSERLDEAQQLLGDALQTVDARWSGRANALRNAAQIARDRADETGAAKFLSAAVAAEPSYERARWALVELHLFQGDAAEARTVFTEAPSPLEPTDAPEALTWLRLLLLGTPDQASMSQAVLLARRFPDAEAVQAAVVMLALQPPAELPEPLVSELQYTVASFVERWPESTYVRRIAVNEDDPEDVVRTFKRELRRSPEEEQRRRELHRQVARGRLPLGLLAVEGGRSYTEVLLARGLGCISTWHAVPAQRAADQSAAAARSSRVILDLSAVLSIQQLDPDVQRLLLSSFPSSRITASSLGDLQRALSVAEQRSTLRMSYDEVDQRLVVHEMSSEAAEQLVVTVRDLQGLARSLAREPDTAPEGQERTRDAWRSSLMTALGTRTPLWSDDPALREAVREEGGDAFSTGDLLEHLTSEGKLSTSRLAEQLRRLLDAAIQVPLAPPLLRASHDAAGGITDGIARTLSNPALWAPPSSGSQWFTSLLSLLTEKEMHRVPELVYWMTRGLAHAQDDPQVIFEVSAALVARTLFTGRTAADATPIVHAARRGLREAHPDDTTPIDFLGQTAKLLHKAVSSGLQEPRLATLWVTSLFDRLSDEDRQTIRLTLLAP